MAPKRSERGRWKKARKGKGKGKEKARAPITPARPSASRSDLPSRDLDSANNSASSSAPRSGPGRFTRNKQYSPIPFPLQSTIAHRQAKKMPPFRDEHILVIAPGSQTTLAQLGLPESLTPASHRFPTRMFAAPDGKSFEPFKIRSRKKEVVSNDGDAEMTTDSAPKEEDDDVDFIEYPDDEEGAIYPLKEGRIVDLPAFFAFLQHVHNTMSPTLHTPIMLIAQPAWTAKNHEDITQFVFEKFKTPGLCLMDSGYATTFAYATTNGTIIDIGYEKVDITVILDSCFSSRGSVPHSGGEAMTQRLVELLKPSKFTHDMAEQLKKSPICEVLPPGTPLPGTDAVEDIISNPAAAASTGATSSGPNVKITDAPRVIVPDIEPVDDEYGIGEDKPIEDDGVLDVASIVTSGKTQEFLAKKEKEKAERAAARKATRDAEKAEAAAAAARPARLPNSKRPRAIFHYEELVKEGDTQRKSPEPESSQAAPLENLATSNGDAKPAEEVTTAAENGSAPVDDEASRREQQKAARKEERRRNREEGNPDHIRRDIEVGTERFQAASENYIDAIADTIYRVIHNVPDIAKRQEAWDNLMICGGGAKVRGLKEAILTTLNNRYLISPSSATMFMSELPSNIATPSGTGSQTPNASFSSTPHAPPTASAVNPLLLAATTASNPALNPNMPANPYNGSHAHSSHSQSPTSIKVLSVPGYFPEWKTFEDAVFLGAEVAARIIFIVDQGASKMFLSRVEFNEEGPTAIHQIGLVN